MLPKKEKKEGIPGEADQMGFQTETESLSAACFQLRHSVKRERTRSKMRGRWEESDTEGELVEK